MKYLLAFALVAVASAVSPVRLLEPVLVQEAVPTPVKVVEAPEAVEDNVQAVKVVDVVEDVATVPELMQLLKPVQLEEYTPLMVPEVANAVKVVEAPEFVDAVKVVDAPEVVDAVKVVDAPEVVDAVKVVDAPEVSEAAENTNTYTVRVVELNEEAPIAITLNQAPLPDSVVLPLGIVLPSIAPAMVNILETDEQSPTYMPMPLRKYPNPYWR